MLPKIAVTLGDPAGVGPEVVVKAAWDPRVRATARLVVVGQERFLARAARAAGLTLPPLEILETGPIEDIPAGGPSPASGRLAGAQVERALELCRGGQVLAMATAPISKEALQAGGYPDSGHTTLLARLTQTARPVMMLAGARLKVVLGTIHCALAEVPRRLSPESLVETATTTCYWLEHYFRLPRPRLAVAALNPHAGEGGIFGDEEPRIITPAIARMRELGLEATGPHPPDTLFWRAVKGEFDCVLAMYHDQGLIPLKLLHFEDGVNITLGLPVVRTSVDHGTAYDLAYTGRANPASLVEAILWAAKLGAAFAEERGPGEEGPAC
ncbi:MAG: 4-hydroxythreonine-4-phosphate dehydrogenase PdxA [Deltaproteobacteria bacterium]|nr:4-hydroxythreonine-4-phosphate dehydrogenase PdxA [Deltaproteobacteria bacterium]